MRVAIGSVIELIRPEPAALLCKATRDVIVIFRILVCFSGTAFTSAPSVRSKCIFSGD